jgi:hypothetical protein
MALFMKAYFMTNLDLHIYTKTTETVERMGMGRIL